MSFIISSGVITQSGTDTSLAGLSAIVGVTTTTYLNLVLYSLDTNRLVITGTLTFNPEKEMLIFGEVSQSSNCLQVSSGGTFNIGNNETKNGFARQNFGKAIHFGRSPASTSIMFGTGNIDVKSGGTLNWYGGEIYSRVAIMFSAGATILIAGTQCVLNGDGSTYGVETGPQVRQSAAALTVHGLTTHDFILTMITNPTLFSGYRPIHSPEAVGLSGSTPNNTYIIFRNPDFSGGNAIDLAFWSKKWLRIINCQQGTNVKSLVHLGSSGGLHEIRQELYVTAVNSVGAVVPVFGVYVADKIGTNPPAAGIVNTSDSYLVQREYPVLASAGTASIVANGGVLTAVHYQAGSIYLNKRGNTNDTQDLFSIRIRNAGMVFQNIDDVSFKGVDGTKVSTILRVNSDYTQSDAVALGHTGITLTDHGGTPVSWNGKSYGITITGNKVTNPGLTIADIYHYLQYHLAQVTTVFNGKFGGTWHSMLQYSGVGYVTELGTYNGTGLVKGVRVVDENGAPFPGVVKMQSDDASFYTPPVQYILTFTGLVTGSDVVVRTANTSTILSAVDQIPGTTWSFAFSTPSAIDVDIIKPGYIVKALLRNYTPNAQDASVPVSQQIDRNYL